MNRPDKKTLALARLIGERASQLRDRNAGLLELRLDDLLATLDSLRTWQQHLKLCRRRGWLVAVASLQERIGWNLTGVSGDIAQLTGLLTHRPPEPQLHLRNILEDLEQIRQEFGEYQYDTDDHTLSVNTDPITLEDIALGSFQICLSLNQLDRVGQSQPYKVYALDPHPAVQNENVTHPHVSEDRLCEGEATTPIRAALSEGRLCDFFILVRSVLQQYNPTSPYVSLDNWYGISCHDCGRTVRDDDSYCCGSCEEDYCSDCIGFCESCDSSCCGGCMERCAGCERRVCSDCVRACSRCHESCCERCAEKGLCPECQKENEHDDQQPEQQSDEGEPAVAAVTADAAG